MVADLGPGGGERLLPYEPCCLGDLARDDGDGLRWSRRRLVDEMEVSLLRLSLADATSGR